MLHSRSIPVLLLLLFAACGNGAEEDRRAVPAPAWLTAEVYDSLGAAGARAIPDDVPAAAAVIYRGRIVTGWNDVNRNANAAGHADINAITRAMRQFGGAEAFKRIDRDSLYLVTTWEPCPMCQGAIADEHHLKPENVVVLMLKDDDLLRSESRNMKGFAARHLYVARPDIQQELFCRHPGYRKEFPEKCGPTP